MQCNKINPDIRNKILIISGTVLAYFNSFKNPLVWDQEVVIAGNPLIRNFRNFFLLFKTNVEGRRLTGIGFYRPLEALSYMFDYSFWELNPLGYHLSSTFLHILNALLLYQLLKKIISPPPTPVLSFPRPVLKTGFRIANRKKREAIIARQGRATTGEAGQGPATTGIIKSLNIPFIIALLFAVHPVNTEVVTYSIRGDLLGLFFSLLCFLFFISFTGKQKVRRPEESGNYNRPDESGNYINMEKWGQSPGNGDSPHFSKAKIFYGALSVITYLAAVLSKEWTVVLPIVILLYYLLFNSPSRDLKGYNPLAPFSKGELKRGGSAVILGALFLLSFIYIAGRLYFMASSYTRPLSLIAYAPFWQRLLTVPRIILTYMRLLILPYNLHMEYHFVTESLRDPYVVFGLPVLVFIIYSIVNNPRTLFFNGEFTEPTGLINQATTKATGLMNQGNYYPAGVPGGTIDPEGVRHRKLVFFFGAWFFIGLALYYNVFPSLHATLTEHWVYFAGIGFIAAVVLLFSRDFVLRNLKVAAARGQGSRRLQPALNLSRLLVFFFVCYFITGTIRRNAVWSEPLKLYLNDLRYEPKSFILHNNVGVILFRNKNTEKAKLAFTNAINVSPGKNYEIAYNNLGVIMENEGALVRAEELFRKSIILNNYELAYGNLSRLYLKTGRLNEAYEISQKGIALFPYNAEIVYNLALAGYFRGEKEFSKKYFEHLKNNIDPDFKDVKQWLMKL